VTFLPSPHVIFGFILDTTQSPSLSVTYYLNGPKGGKGEEHDFIIIDGNRKLIILVEAKKTLKSVTVKNAKLQLTQQVKYIRDYHDLQV
jgi:hypothetical protein